MCRLWSALSVVRPFQQFGKRTLKTSALSSEHCGTTTNRFAAPPPQLHETMLFC